MVTLRILGAIDGTPTPWDGQYVVEYDPSCAGMDSLSHLLTTPDRSKARRFRTYEEAWNYSRQVDPREPVRHDGQPNRPLTVFTTEIDGRVGKPTASTADAQLTVRPSGFAPA